MLEHAGVVVRDADDDAAPPAPPPRRSVAALARWTVALAAKPPSRHRALRSVRKREVRSVSRCSSSPPSVVEKK